MFREGILQPVNVVSELVYAISMYPLGVQNQPGEYYADADQPSHFLFHARNLAYRLLVRHRANLAAESRKAGLRGTILFPGRQRDEPRREYR